MSGGARDPGRFRRGLSRVPLGELALLAAVTGVASGLFLAFHYAPTLDDARASIAHLERQVALGGLLRAVHHWCGSVAIVLGLLHAARTLVRGGHLGARRRLWLCGVGIGVVLVLLAWTGYLLVGDARAWTGLEVARGVGGGAPLVGRPATDLLLGGPVLGSATLVRLYALHAFVLPALLALLVAVFGRAAPGDQRLADRLRRAAPWTPALAGTLLALALLAPPGLGPAADPVAGAAADARPEWFLLWVNELLRVGPANPFWMGAAVPLALLTLVAALPWLTRGRARRLEVGGAAVVVLALVALSLITLSVRALPDGEGDGSAEERDAAAPRVAAAHDATRRERLERDVAEVLERFRCAKCHVIDGDPEGGDTGPPLDREGFAELYTRRFFRLKVADPIAFWEFTGMVYSPRRLKPTEEQLDLLERWFFRDGPP